MANKKITDLTELTAAASDDYLEIVDTSANTSKKISRENLIGGGGGGGVTDHGALTGLSDDDHPQYLLTTGTAADSDKLDGLDSTGFVQTSGNQTVGGIKTFTSIPALPATNPTTANQAMRKGFADATYLGISAKAADSDKLDGLDSTDFATAGHDHDGRYYTETEMDLALGLKADKTITLTAGEGLTGGGNLSANRTFDVNPGAGIAILDDKVIVDQTENFNWTGEHTFTQYLSTASIYPNTSDTYDLGDYNRLWRKIWGSELSAIVFAQYTQVLLGGWFTVSKGEGIIQEAVNNTQTTIDLGTNNFTTNDIIVFRGIGAGNNPQIEYMKVGTLVSGTTYNVIRDLDGTGANAWPEGSVYGNWGQTGNGRVELNAYDTPRMSVYSQGMSYNDATEEIRIGDLYGQWGYNTNTYGAAFGSYKSGKANITIDPTNGIRIRNYNQDVIKLTGTAASFENFITLGTNGGIRQGTGTWGSSFTGTAMWNDSGVMNVGGWKDNVKQWWGGSDGKLKAGEGDVILDENGIAIRSVWGDEYINSDSIKFQDIGNTEFVMAKMWAFKSFGLSPTNRLWIETETDDATYGTSIVLFAHKTVGGSADDATVTITSKAGTIPSWIRLLANDILLIGNVEIDGYDDIPGDLVVNGTIKDGSGIAYGAWQDWTPTQTGWTNGTLAGTFRYCKIGNLVNCMIAITAGTSNGVTAVLSLPVQPAGIANLSRGTWGWGQDAGIQVNPAGGWLISSAGGGTISFFKTSIDGAGWTSSSTKRIYCMFFYEAA
jgi:hypothetical protein